MSAAPSQFAPGRVVGERFEIRERIGEGGMARVFRADDLRDGGAVALKVLRPELAASPEAVERLAREAEILRRLNHPSLVRLRATGALPGGGLYLAMELLSGESLGRRLRRASPLPLADFARVVAAACAGLHAAHCEGIVHRDLKPENVFLSPEGGPVKVLDFGLSKLLGELSLTRPGELLGTPRYMAPEQLRPGHHVGPPADLYALGAIAYECLAGRPPYVGRGPADTLRLVLAGDAPSLSAQRPDLPEPLCEAVMRALRGEPQERFVSALALGDALLTALPGRLPGSPATAPMGAWPTHAGSRPRGSTPARDAPLASAGASAATRPAGVAAAPSVSPRPPAPGRAVASESDPVVLPHGAGPRRLALGLLLVAGLAVTLWLALR